MKKLLTCILLISSISTFSAVDTKKEEILEKLKDCTSLFKDPECLKSINDALEYAIPQEDIRNVLPEEVIVELAEFLSSISY
ncbi:MAG: hypothetical protein HON90_06110 [Halobacteriovoraceae bacterium]|jgi:hypothetical protein|nr:hypothetical protein [Halobacteriovoraceae bacterium]